MYNLWYQSGKGIPKDMPPYLQRSGMPLRTGIPLSVSCYLKSVEAHPGRISALSARSGQALTVSRHAPAALSDADKESDASSGPVHNQRSSVCLFKPVHKDPRSSFS